MKVVKRSINFIIAGLIFIIFVLLIINRQTQNKLKHLEQEKTALQKQLTRIQTPATTKQNILLLDQKEKTLATIKKTQLYFTAQTNKISQNQWQVIIYLAGDTESAADAADLWLDFTNNFKVSEIKTGSAFPLYPRQVIENNHVLITGLASIIDNQITYGKPGKILAEIIVSGNIQPNQNLLKLNFDETKIFLNGESVFDAQKTIKQIELF